MHVILIFNNDFNNGKSDLLNNISFDDFINNNKFIGKEEIDRRDRVLATKTFFLLQEALAGNLEVMSTILVKFGLKTDDKVEYIYAYVKGDINENEFKVELVNDSFFGKYKAYDEVLITSEDLIDWKLDINVLITPLTSFGLMKSELKDYFKA